MRIAIVDYQLGNLFSVQQACFYLGFEAVITSDASTLLSADYAILPGVGAFADAIHNMHNLDLVEPLRDYIASGRPFMGVCLGLQLLFSESEEFGITKGLNFIEGVVKRFPSHNIEGGRLKIPQIAWNKIQETPNNQWMNTPLRSCKNDTFMYFVHSYYVQPNSDSVILSTTRYGGHNYCSSVIKNNIFACQFHPEKSGMYGLEIYRNFLSNKN